MRHAAQERTQTEGSPRRCWRDKRRENARKEAEANACTALRTTLSGFESLPPSQLKSLLIKHLQRSARSNPRIYWATWLDGGRVVWKSLKSNDLRSGQNRASARVETRRRHDETFCPQDLGTS